MSDHLHHHRDLPPSATSSVSDGLVDSTGGGGSTTKMPEEWRATHLQFVMLDAIRRFETGDLQGGLTSLGHAVFVAAFTGPQGLSQHEVVQLVRRVTGFEYHPDLKGAEET